MSLINNALKKAQREREGNRPDRSKLPVTGPRPGNPASTTSFKIMRWSVACILLFSGLGAAITFLITLLQKGDPVVQEPPREVAVTILTTPRPKPEHAESPLTVSPPPSTAPANTVFAEEPTPAPPHTPAVEEILPAAQATQVASVPAEIPESAPEITVATTPSQAPVQSGSPSPVEESSSSVPADTPTETAATLRTISEQPVVLVGSSSEPNPAIIRFLEEAKVTGIKVAGVHSRVLMNNQVFRIGSIVEPTTRLTITDILENEIHFTDESGLQYRKQF